MVSYKLLTCLLFLFVNAQFGFTQHNTNAKKLDSLQRVVAKNKDSKKTRTALLALSNYYFDEDTQNLDSLYYYANKTLGITKGNTELEEQNVDALYYLAYHAYKIEQIDSAKAYNAQVNSISEKLIYGMGLRNASLLSGFIGERENKPNLAIFYFENAYKITKDYNLPQKVQFNTALELSSAYLRFKFPKKDISTILFENKPIVDDPNIAIEDQALFYFNLGSFYNHYTNDEEKAIEHFITSIDLFTNHDATELLYKPLIKLSESYQKNGQHNKAIETLNKTLNLVTALQQDDMYPAVYYDLGLSYLETKDYVASESNFNQAIALHEKNNDLIGKADCLQQIGKLYLKQVNSQKAQSNLNLAIESYKTGITQLQKEQPLNAEIGNAYQQIANIHELNKNYKESAAYYTLYNKFRDQYFREQAVLIPEQLNYLEEEVAKTKAIEILESEAEIREIEAKKAKNLKIGLGLFLALAGLLTLIVFNRYRLKQKAVKIIDQKNEEKKLLIREIHHRVKNNLQIISSLLGVKINDTTNDKLKLILQESQNKIKSMALIHQNLYKSNQLTKVSLTKYINELISEIKSSFNDKGNTIKLELDIEDVQIQLDFALPLGLILNELITNVYKYAFIDSLEKEHVISVNFHKLKDTRSYALSVKDNGKGLPANFNLNNVSSFGLQLVQGLTQQLHGTLMIVQDKGTTFNMVLEAPHEG